MQTYSSSKNIKFNNRQARLSLPIQAQLSLPRIKSQSQHLTIQSTKKSNLQTGLIKHKRSKMLLKQIMPAKIGELQSDSDTSAIIRDIITPQKKTIKQVEVAVLTLNKNPKNRLKNRFNKQIFIGEEAVQKYYERYKHFDRYKQKQEFQHQDNPITHIIELLQLYSFAPRKLDLIKLKGSHAILDLKKLSLGHGQIGNVVAQLIKYLGNFDYVDLSSNGIDRTLSQTMIQSLTKCKIVNLSFNRIGKIACEKLSKIFLDPKTKLQQLYLEDNHLMDNAGVILISQLADYNNLRVLNLNKNFMSTKFASAIKQYLQKDDVLEQLYLGWNQIGDKAAKNIFQAIQKHSDIKVLDYSWNIIGIFSTKAIAKALQYNQSLIHVDISFCEINRKNADIIAKALEQNHTLYGMHFQGNSGFIDSKGYLRITPQQHHNYPLPIVKGLIRKIDSIHPNTVRNLYQQKTFQDICWICESWQEVFIQIKKTDPEVKQIYIHFNCEQFKSVKMLEQNGYYMIYRMCPIQQIQFFFTKYKNPGSKQHFSSENYQKIDANKQISFSIGQIKMKHYFSKLNLHKNDYFQDLIDENYFSNVHCVPRSQQVRVNFEQKHQINFKKTKKVLIKVKKKVLREYNLGMKFRQLDQKGGEQFMRDGADRDNDEEYLKKCLQFDISNSKINRLIKDPQDRESFKVMMTNYYRDFKDCFYFIASTSPSISGVYYISEQPFDRFLEQQKYITKRITQAKVMLKMYSCLSGNDDENSSPQKKGTENYRLFSRPQFLEFLIRLAIQKWCTTIPKPKKNKQDQKDSPQKKEGQQNNDLEESRIKKQKLHTPLPLLEGLQKTMKTLPKYAYRVRASIWRKNKYLVIDNYTVIKGYQSFLLTLFDKYGNNKKRLDKPKKIRGLITLSECKSIILDSNIKQSRQATKDVDVPFLNSKRLQIQDGKIQYGLNFDQFCQFLARYSQVLWFPPIACQTNQLWQFQNNRMNLPLFIRFESLIVNLYRRNYQFHNRRMDILTKYGIFQQESQILIQKIFDMERNTAKTDLWMKMNQTDSDNVINLKDLVQGLRDKYQNATVMKQQQLQQEQQRQQIDD